MVLSRVSVFRFYPLEKKGYFKNMAVTSLIKEFAGLKVYPKNDKPVSKYWIRVK